MWPHLSVETNFMNNDKWLCEYCKWKIKYMQNNTFLDFDPINTLPDTGATLTYA